MVYYPNPPVSTIETASTPPKRSDIVYYDTQSQAAAQLSNPTQPRAKNILPIVNPQVSLEIDFAVTRLVQKVFHLMELPQHVKQKISEVDCIIFPWI